MTFAQDDKQRACLVVGATGQDGYYLTEALKSDNRSVFAISRSGILAPDATQFSPFSLTRRSQTDSLLRSLGNCDVYYLAAHQHSSEQAPLDAAETLQRCYVTHVEGAANILESIRKCAPGSRFFYAASSHVFGRILTSPQNELTPINPANPYGITKAAGIHLCRFFRTDHNLFASVGILYNHESPRRETFFLGRKIVSTAVAIHRGRDVRLTLGDIDGMLDWGGGRRLCSGNDCNFAT